MAIRGYAGTARPVINLFENDSRFRPVEWDHADASIIRGYQEIAVPTNLVGGACIVVSPARQAALNAVQTARTTTEAGVATFKASIAALMQKIKDNTATPAEQRAYMVKLGRVALGALSD